MNTPQLNLAGWGTARADLTSIAAMRKSLPEWSPKDTPGHFLKHADEQTVLAVAAMDQAISSSGRQASDFADWAIIAAPRFIGRLSGTGTLARFCKGGGPAISPHLIPQHSLHSISGALSILLQSRKPNFGVGGTGDSLAEGLLAALTFPFADCAGAWVIATGWEPEPQIDDAGACINSPICHATALAMDTAAQATASGQLRLLVGDGTVENHRPVKWFESAAGLSQALRALTPGGPTGYFAWRLNWGATIVLEAREMLAQLQAAA